MSETPNGSTVQAHSADGDVFDITENVKAAYDLLVASLDWGSGFLDHQEEHLIYDLGERLGFELPVMGCFMKRVNFAEGEGCGGLCSPYPGMRAHWHMINTGICQVRSDR